MRNHENTHIMVEKNQNNPNVITEKATYRSGPLPAPQDFKEYENVCPGAADRILTMVEEQSAHRQKVELVTLNMAFRDSLLKVKRKTIIIYDIK